MRGSFLDAHPQMAELNVRHDEPAPLEDDYSMLEVIFWIIGILAIPGVPILMIKLFTPFSGL